MKRCPMCAAQTSDAAKVCYECFYSFELMSCVAMQPTNNEPAAQDATDAAPAEPVEVEEHVPVPNALLVVNDPEMGERTFGLSSGSVFIGRLPSNEIVLNDSRVSRRHAHVFAERGRFMVEDLEATNPALLNGEPLRGRAALNPGDVIQVRSATLRFELA